MWYRGTWPAQSVEREILDPALYRSKTHAGSRYYLKKKNKKQREKENCCSVIHYLQLTLPIAILNSRNLKKNIYVVLYNMLVKSLTFFALGRKR